MSTECLITKKLWYTSTDRWQLKKKNSQYKQCIALYSYNNEEENCDAAST